MKILSSFDTKRDEKIFKETLNQFWDAHPFMIKRHWLYLYRMLFYWFLVIWILGILFYILNYLLSPTSLIIIIILNLIWIWIWLVVTFYQLLQYLSKYKEITTTISEKDLKDGLLEKYLKFSLFLFIYQIFVSILTVYLSINSTINNTSSILVSNIMLNILQIIISFLFIYLIWKTIYSLINFEMDFVIITPKYIDTYNQTWLFKKETKSIGVEKIKSIQTNKKWILRSLFNFWEIIILTEWDEAWKWEIKLKYIAAPDKIKQKIITLMNVE